jgi:WD40 repeat protein
VPANGELFYGAAFSPDTQKVLKVLTVSGDKRARVWSADDGQLLATLEGHSGDINSAVFSPDGERIVTASDDKTVRIWSLAAGKLLATLEGHTEAVHCATFSPDGKLIVTGGDDNKAPYGVPRAAQF